VRSGGALRQPHQRRGNHWQERRNFEKQRSFVTGEFGGGPKKTHLHHSGGKRGKELREKSFAKKKKKRESFPQRAKQKPGFAWGKEKKHTPRIISGNGKKRHDKIQQVRNLILPGPLESHWGDRYILPWKRRSSGSLASWKKEELVRKRMSAYLGKRNGKEATRLAA